MGAASLDTIKACYEVALEYSKLIMIDLLEVSDDKLNKLEIFKDAIFCIHLSTDSAKGNLISLIKDFKNTHPEIIKLAVAGGVNQSSIQLLKELNIDIVVIGGAITKSENIEASVKSFREVL
jgi:3-hexulose-6-phosphate synthase